MIKSAKEIAANQNTSLFDTSCEQVMRAIENASSIGKRSCLFNPRPVELYSAVKLEFQRHGYRFEPYGYSGGVWQDAENICW